uniref:ATPase/GTPase, AAA15 family n=1 Tax=Candidatus Kentrum sp. LFY TaxID=2126342 RepID=A0A450U547_9GAMM|nr:MAG: ATPase/GTPase, AAA15 family [Candidatus Kentron sp. LFY]
MKIESLEYIDHASGWRLEKTDFDRLTLLVGASGVGKSRILEAILHLKQIAGASLPLLSSNGVGWNIRFSTSSGRLCEWEGRFEIGNLKTKGSPLGPSIIGDNFSPSIEFEKLIIDGSLIVNHGQAQILFQRLSCKKSAIELFKEQEIIKEVHNEFSKILFDDSGPKRRTLDFMKSGVNSGISFDPEEELPTLDAIKNSGEQTESKLYRTYVNRLPVFEDIKGLFIEVFPYIQDLRVELSKTPSYLYSNMSPEVESIDSYSLHAQIKETGVPDWIDEERISSGMLKTLLHIAELYLCPDHSLILIDEFENSLGVNCIDEMTSTMLAPERNLQFILTSHHPYIINNIGPEYWKIVTRKGSVVTTRDAAALGIGRSKHEAFIQLINREEYSEGVTA